MSRTLELIRAMGRLWSCGSIGTVFTIPRAIFQYVEVQATYAVARPCQGDDIEYQMQRAH